ncbi:hypothetical protein F4861DRAFT_538139 [Xylaria intraflava]|nr:hypothetical protein F4861DRAFT_538139 [Xylaria intraflava]
MAEFVPDIQLPSDSFFDIYADVPPTTSNPLNLPGGPCNYTDLTHGGGGHKCGCRRFWSRAAFGGSERGGAAGPTPGLANGFEDQTAWCMCSHHACFHDDVREGQTQISNPVVAPSSMNGQENERPRTNREPLTPVMPDLSFKLPYPGSQQMDFNAVTNYASFSHEHEGTVPPNEPAAPAKESSLPDTLAWSNPVQPSPEQGLLPPIPSQCLMPSQPSSTTSSARITYLKPFAGKGLQTLSGARPPTLEPLGEEGHVAVPEARDAGEIDVDQSVDDLQTVANTPRSTRHTDITEGPNPSATRRVNGVGIHLLSNTVKGHEQRLENLESMSFSAAGHDVCHEKHDQTDLRVTELETRVEELERILNDNTSNASVHGWPRRERANGATPSVASVSAGSDYGNMSRAQIQDELQSIKAEMGRLRQFPSSFPTQLWEVEVVFLPFPLQSVWIPSGDPINRRRSNDSFIEIDPWMQMPNNYHPQSPSFGDWGGPEVDSDWLVGRACASDNLIGQRLKSRGLVKNVTVRGLDARSVADAMSEAFGTLFRTFSRMQANVHHGATGHHYVSKFLGLQSPWIPLRKVHKDSRLRFLTPAEMVTSVSWDVQFLSSSVVMKSHGVHRLFITHPEAYLQDQDAYETGWSWQRLRELSRVYADSQSSQEILEGDAREECWVWNAILDEPPAASGPASSVQQLQSSAQEHWRAMASSSRDAFAISRATPSSVAIRRSVSRALSPAVFQERRPSKPPRIRTGSIPPHQALISPATTNRRVASNSHAYERHVSQPPRVAHIARNKRRSTRSPSLRPRLNRFTPRWSTASPTPVPEVLGGRATTPFYATPYSNVPYVDARAGRPSVIIIDGNMGFDGAEGGSDIDVYDDEAVEHDYGGLSSEGDDDDHSMVDMGYNPHESWQDGQLPEDEPWPGIEDVENRDPDTNVHVHDAVVVGGNANGGLTAASMDEHDTQSQSSSVPSEYPSNEPLWITSGREQEFRVFEHK